jgi:poly(3-hydroxybutyrate) depolymerase
MKSVYFAPALVGALVLGCSGSSVTMNPGSSGGSDATGGTQSAVGGGANTGGGVTTGGNSPSTGGSPAASGGNASGGANPATGGNRAAGGANPATGGRDTGGAGVGGSTGGTTGYSAGGQIPIGGKSTAGGSSSAGGQATGGKSTAGGSSSAGGQATGGKSTAGGSSAAGGASPGGAAAMSSGCGKAPTIASSQYNNGTTISITAASMQRRYILNVPTNYDNTKPYKLIIAWHQLDGNDKQMYANGYYHLLNLSGNSAIFVAPDGQKNGAPCAGTGNGESGCGWPNTNDSDLALADAVVAQIEQNFCVDTNRIFATGWSYGGSMSYRTACSRPQGGTASWGVKAVAVYSGAQLSGTCTPSKPVAYYASHGTNDTVLNYDMGLGLFQNFAKANGCTYVVPTKVTSGNHVCTSMAGCTAGFPSEFCSFNGGHTPDPTDGGTSWEYQNVWTFLNQF